jgi:hypothetical protein
MAYCAERDEEFHVSTVFSYYTTAYFAQILWQLILVSSNGIAMALNYSGIILPMLSLAISFDTNYPTYHFQRFKSSGCYKIQFLIVSKQPLTLRPMAAVIGSMVDLLDVVSECFYTLFITHVLRHLQ